MHVHPAVAALRRDPGSQRRSRTRMEAALRDWSTRESEVAAAVEAYDAGSALVGLPALALLMGEADAAQEFVDGFVSHFIMAQREEALSEVPLRHSSSEGFSRIQLMQCGGTVLSLCVYEPVSNVRAATTVRFVDCDLHEMIIAGSARGRVHRLKHDEGGATTIASSELRLQAGDAFAQPPICAAREFVEVEQSLLILQLSRTSLRPRPSREYRLDDGALVQQISGDRKASEQLMALSVLGALDHREALSEMERFARHEGNDLDARWEAVRQSIALDTTRGMQLLASFPASDPLARPAQELRAGLIASHPSLQSAVSEHQ